MPVLVASGTEVIRGLVRGGLTDMGAGHNPKTPCFRLLLKYRGVTVAMCWYNGHGVTVQHWTLQYTLWG